LAHAGRRQAEKDLETLMAVLSAKDMEDLYRSLRKLGLLAAENLNQQAEVKYRKEQSKHDHGVWR
jgi:hypothetical protein